MATENQVDHPGVSSKVGHLIPMKTENYFHSSGKIIFYFWRLIGNSFGTGQFEFGTVIARKEAA